MRNSQTRWSVLTPVIASCFWLSCGSDRSSTSEGAGPRGIAATPGAFQDPGQAEWTLVSRDRVAAECGLDPKLLDEIDRQLDRPYAIVRYGKLCHEYYPPGETADRKSHVYSLTKTLTAVVTGALIKQVRETSVEKGGSAFSLQDRVDRWLTPVPYNRDARISHVLAMVAHSQDLAQGQKRFTYDFFGTTQVNTLGPILNKVLRKQADPRLGANLEEFTRKHLYGPLGMKHTVWSSGFPDKIVAFSMESTVRDLARLGLLIAHNGFWNGQQLLDEDFVYQMTHPAYEDGNTGYGFLTWLNSRYNYATAQGVKQLRPLDGCAPAALHAAYPHGLSAAQDCNYQGPEQCGQKFDAGVFHAAGIFGQVIAGHRGLDLVMVVKNMSQTPEPGDDSGDIDPDPNPDPDPDPQPEPPEQKLTGGRDLWKVIRPAVVAQDPIFRGDEEAFCRAYGNNEYAPSLAPLAPEPPM